MYIQLDKWTWSVCQGITEVTLVNKNIFRVYQYFKKMLLHSQANVFVIKVLPSGKIHYFCSLDFSKPSKVYVHLLIFMNENWVISNSLQDANLSICTSIFCLLMKVLVILQDASSWLYFLWLHQCQHNFLDFFELEFLEDVSWKSVSNNWKTSDPNLCCKWSKYIL